MQKHSNQNPHCLRSKKLNDDQLLLLKQFGDQQKSNKMEYKLLQESINNLKKENRINKKVNYSPPSIRKNSRSNNNKKVNSYTKKKNSKNLKKIRQNSDRANSGRNKKERNNIKTIENQKIQKKKNNLTNNITEKKNSSSINKDIVNENEQDIIGKKKIGVKKLIHNYEILDIKDDNKINNEINPINPTNNIKNNSITIDFINNAFQQPEQIPKVNYQSLLGNIITNTTQNINPIITANITNINRITNNYYPYPSSIYTPRIEVKEPLPLSNINIINSRPTYGKIVNNKRVIFGLYHRPKEDFHKILKKKKRRRRRLKNVLNYKKYQEKLKEMPNYVNNNNEFKYLFETSHRIAKNYWHVKVDIVNSTRYVDYSDSDESYTKIKVGRKRGRKRRRMHNNNDNDDSNFAEINAISELRKNLEKTDADVELLFNRDSLEKSSGSQSLIRDDF